MLGKSRTRAERLGLGNVELVEADAATVDFPESLDRVLATFSLSMMPEPERVLARAAGALEPEGRLAVLDFRIPASWPRPIRRSAFALVAPLGETWAMAERDLRPLVRRHVIPGTERRSNGIIEGGLPVLPRPIPNGLAAGQ